MKVGVTLPTGIKSAVWLSRGPETQPLVRLLLNSGYRRAESQRVRSETKAAHPKSIDLYVREAS